MSDKSKSVSKLKSVKRNVARAVDAVDAFTATILSSSTSLKSPSSSSSSSTTLATTTPAVSTSNSFSILGDIDNIFTMPETLPTLSTFKPISSSATMEEKMDQILAIILNTNGIVERLESEFKVVKTQVVELQKEVVSIKKELRTVKESVNRSELASRNLSVRILGLPVLEDETPSSIIKQAYEKILKPILTAAKNNQKLEAIPQQKTLIEDGYRLKNFQKDNQDRPLPPPVIIKLSNKTIRTIIFQNKREAIPAPSAAEIARGVKQYFVVEDLTLPTLKKIKELRDDDRVTKVWTTEGAIRFTLKDTPDVVRKCPGAFAPLSEFIK